MKYLRKFNENYSDLEKEEQEKAKKTAISNSPYLQKKEAEKRKNRLEKSYKEDPDGMYPRDTDDKIDDITSRGWQNGMGEPPWLSESNVEFDVEFAITKIKDKFSEDEVNILFDNELLEWVDPDWSDEYDSEYDWYVEHNNGEAQDVVIDQLIDWYMKEYGEISVDEQIELKDRIKKEYDVLNYY
jgi:hypothetical protein